MVPGPRASRVRYWLALMLAAGWGSAARADTPPAAPADPEAAAPVPAATPSWFARPPFTLTAGSGESASGWSLTFFGFVELDALADSTRSYDDAIGPTLVARSDTYEGRTDRTQFSVRNTRLGLALAAPVVGGVRPSAVLEGDFFGAAPSAHAGPASASEASFFDNPSFRIRHAYVRLESAAVEVVAGQTYELFGWQNLYFPCTATFLGVPNQVFARAPQLRFGHTFNAGGAISVDVAAAAVRPAQRDSQIPDGQAGLRLAVNGWKGIATQGNVSTTVQPLSFGVSAVGRSFKVDAFTPPPTQASNTTMGWGVSVDALIPLIPARDAGDRGNRLTVIGSFVMGSGIADLITSGGGARFPTLPNPAQANPPPLYAPNVDDGLVSFDTQGVLHAIEWRAVRAGLEYHLPGSGRLFFAANVTQSTSSNIAKLFPRGGAEIELLGSVADTSRYADANVFWDATPSVRLGLSGQYTEVRYLDGNRPHNLRGTAQALFVF